VPFLVDMRKVGFVNLCGGFRNTTSTEVARRQQEIHIGLDLTCGQ
jgi:hypothetical protein